MGRVTLQSRFPEIAAELRSRISRATKAGTEVVAASARAKAPVESGALSNSIKVKAKRAGEYAVETDVFYARFIEYGTVNMAARPFLIPALEEHRFEIEAGVQEVLRTI